MSKFVVGITGHRPPKLGGYGKTDIKDWVVTQLTARFLLLEAHYGPLEVLSGCAQGADQLAAFEAWRLRRDGHNIKLTMVMPYPSFGETWPAQAQSHLGWLIRQADQTIFVNDGEYQAWKLQARNEWIADYSNLLIAVYDGSPGGTANTIKYAISQGKNYYQIDPKKRVCRLVEPTGKKNVIQLGLNL